MRLRYQCFAVLSATVLSACAASATFPVHAVAEARRGGSGSASPIQHVVIVVQENRTFNDFFATYPGADGTTSGLAVADKRCHIRTTGNIELAKTGLIDARDFDHNYQGYRIARDAGKMDSFDQIPFSDGTPECTYPYQYVDPTQIRPYWQIAKSYVLAEHMFTTQGSSSFTGHQDLIAAGTIVEPNEAMVNLPSCSGKTCRWGCDAPPGTHTALISSTNDFQPGKGPFPCTNQFASTYPTLRDLLDAKGVGWKYYAPRICCNTNGRLFTAFDVIAAVRYGPEWKTNMSSPQTNIFKDISDGKLAAVSWLIPDEADSDHPGEKVDTGPAWVASVVNAIGESPYWNSTVIVIVWDDWGGLYDNLNPRQVGYGGLGFRVPALVVSAYAKPGFISRTNYEFGSILKYVEDNWDLGSLGGSDKRAASLIDCFNYSQPPLRFTPIPSQYSKSYFLRRKPAYLPPDSDF